MSDQTTRQDSGGSGDSRGRQGSPLVTDRGSTSISKGSVSQIIDTVAERAEGLRIGGSGTGGGTSVQVGQEEVAIDIKATADYNRSILQVTEAFRHDVTDRVESLLGLRVSECNITISDIYFPDEERRQQRQQEEESEKAEEPRVR